MVVPCVALRQPNTVDDRDRREVGIDPPPKHTRCCAVGSQGCSSPRPGRLPALGEQQRCDGVPGGAREQLEAPVPDGDPPHGARRLLQPALQGRGRHPALEGGQRTDLRRGEVPPSCVKPGWKARQYLPACQWAAGVV